MVDRALDAGRGGPYRALVDLAEAFAADGHDVTVASPDVTDARATWDGGAGRPVAVRLHARASRAPGGTVGLDELLADADVLLLRGVWAPLNVRAARRATKADVPWFLSVDGMLDDWSMRQSPLRKGAHLAIFGRRLLGRAAAVHCTARGEARQVAARVPAGTKLAIVPNLLDLAELERIPILAPTRPPVMLYLSRIHPKKRPELLVEAFGRLEGDAELHFVGGGESALVDALRQRAERLGVSDRVHFRGFLSGRDLLDAYAGATALVLPSQQENFGNVFFEALAAGLHVVTSPEVDTAGELASSGNATIVEPTPDLVAAAMRDVLARTPAQAAAAAKAGRTWVVEELTTSRILDAWYALFDGTGEVATVR